jgi:spore coat protein A
MKISRRKFIQVSALAGGAMFLPMPFRWLGSNSAYAFYQSSGLGLSLFSQDLRGSDAVSLATQIGVAKADVTPAPVTGVTHYTMNLRQFTDTLHPNLGPTTLWGFAPTSYLVAGPPTPRHLGGIVVAKKGVPLQFTFNNLLPATHPIPVDTTIPGANQARNRAAVHLHGGLVPWISDGGPFDWFAPDGSHGLSFLNNEVLNPANIGFGMGEYYYPNNQSARMLWYHDHAYGITRINAYAGIASAYIIRDDFELGLGLPRIEAPVTGDPVPSAEIPIVIQDKIFVGPNILALDPTWPGPQGVGSLWYAHVYEKNRWKVGGNGKLVTPDPSVIPEYFGDTMLANGTVYPKVAVEPKAYRLRILNACNARFLNLQLYVADGSADGITLNPLTGSPTNGGGPTFRVIGTEGGFLQHPVDVPSNASFNPLTLTGSLVTGLAERWDVLVDFSAFAGKRVILYNDAPAPFPIGDARNDYFPGFNVKGNPVNATTLAGQGPNTREIMRFDVGTTVTSPGAPMLPLTTNLKPGLDPFLAPITGGIPVPPLGVTVRQLTLNETFDAYGRLIQLEGTNVPLVKGTFGRAYTDLATETPLAGSTEIWEIANLTGDTHPIHFHLVNVQILNRQPFKVPAYNGIPSFLGPPVPPAPYELGWKETVKMNPGEVTRVIMRFDLPSITKSAALGGGTVPVPASPRTGGNEYVYHCHILEHEEHDMMRPLVVL